MKTTILTAAVFVFALFTVNANEVENTVTDFGAYEVEDISASPVIENSAAGEYTIHYTELNAPVYVSVVEKKNCKLYLVRTYGYELQYICNGNEFGVQLMDKKYAKIPYKTILSKIDKDAFRHQRVISTKKHTEEEFVKLIACFFPEVLG